MNKEQQDKQAFFAMYWNQHVLWLADANGKVGRHADHVCVRTMKSTAFEHMFLELKNIANITDEDAIEVAKIRWGKDVEIHKIYRLDEGVVFKLSSPAALSNGTEGIYLRRLYQDEADHLRYRGYLVPFRGMSCEELISKGWVKIKES